MPDRKLGPASSSRLQTDESFIVDTTTDPTSNGEFRRNGSDVKVQTGGGVKNLSQVGSNTGFAQVTTSTNSLLSSGESHWAKSSNGSLVLQLPTPTKSAGVRIKHIDDGGTGNTCTVSANTSESIDGGGTTFTVPLDSSYEFESDGTNWETH